MEALMRPRLRRSRMLLRAVDRAWVKVADELLMATISAVGRREKGVEAATWRTFVEISSLTFRDAPTYYPPA